MLADKLKQPFFYEDHIVTYADNFQMVLDSWSNWNLEMLICAEGGKPENPVKNPRSKGENQQTTQLTYDTKENMEQFLYSAFHECLNALYNYGQWRTLRAAY
jgi:hypothetical protein